MPLYMDFHKLPRITIGEARLAHLADEKIQEKYGVRYLQFWVNEQAGTLFCLVEGPDKPTVENVHRMAHGHIACAMVEVDHSYYSLIMGDSYRVVEGLVHDEHGSVDLGYRNIMAIILQEKFSPEAKKSFSSEAMPDLREDLLSEVLKAKGRNIKATGDDFLVSVFDSPTNALQCACEIQSLILHHNKKPKGGGSLSFSIGLCSGQPVTENNEFIEVTVRLAKRLSLVAGEGNIVLSSLIHELCDSDLSRKGAKKIRSLTSAEGTFLTKLFEILEKHLSDENFTIEALVRAIGISRPQLYRKIQSLTGKAPNDLIRDVRLHKSLSLLKRKSGNISEIAFQVGFGNPSYFSKCFSKKFGCLPSAFVSISA